MNTVTGLTLAQIAAKPYFSGIPLGSIGAIAKGYIPAKWEHKLKTYPPPRARVSCNTKDMQSMFDSISKKISTEQMQDLTKLFLMELVRRKRKNIMWQYTTDKNK